MRESSFNRIGLFKLFSVLVLFVSLIGHAYGQGQDLVAACAPLLAGGAFKITKQDGSTKTFTSSKDWFCSDQFTEVSKSGGRNGGITVPIDDIPVGATYDENNAMHTAARTKFCSDATKKFSESQNSFLLKKEGDPVLVNGYLKCIERLRGDFLQIDVPASRAKTFRVSIESLAFPGDNPLIVDVTPVVNAEIVTAPKAGDKIPFINSGLPALKAVLKFQGSGNADVKVKTTIGDALVTAKQCPAGEGGQWHVEGDVEHKTQGIPRQISQAFAVPQAGCHPKCHPGEGDNYPFTLSAPAGYKFVSTRHDCNDGACVFEEYPAETQPNESSYSVTIKSRSAAVTLVLSGTIVQETTNTVREMIGPQQKLRYGQMLFVSMPSKGAPVAIFNSTDYGTAALTSASLQGNALPNWLRLSGAPQANGDATIYNVLFDAPDCF